MNIDKGNQSVGGVDMQVVANIGNTLPCEVGDNTPPYPSKTLTLSEFSVTAASDGSIWLVLGTDSGFEGITTLYYDSVSVSLTRVE